MLKLVFYRACRFVQVAACDISRDVLRPGHLTRLIHWQSKSVIRESLRVFNLVITGHYFFNDFLRRIENYLFLNDFCCRVCKGLIRLSYHLLCPYLCLIILSCFVRFRGSRCDCKLFIKLEYIVYPVINHLFVSACILFAIFQYGNLSRGLI